MVRPHPSPLPQERVRDYHRIQRQVSFRRWTRQERGQGRLSAVAEVEEMWNIKVAGIATLDTLVAYLGEQRESRHHLAAIEAYRAQYGG